MMVWRIFNCCDINTINKKSGGLRPKKVSPASRPIPLQDGPAPSAEVPAGKESSGWAERRGKGEERWMPSTAEQSRAQAESGSAEAKRSSRAGGRAAEEERSGRD